MIHLSFFTGIGTASLALQKLKTHALHTFWWETDPACIQHFEQTFNINHTFMGDVWNIDIRELVDTIRAHAIPGTRILITTAPPCKDHSKIRDSPPGLQGRDGSLLQHMVDIEWSIRLSIPEHPIDSLMENVLPHDSIQEQFDDITDQWGTTPIVLDAADGHMVSRPRLWWNTIQWEPVQEMISSQTPWQLTWTEHPPYTKLHNPIAADLQPNIQMKGWETPNILTQGGLFHCLTTQAINDTGRPPPQHTDVDQATWARWEQGQRQFPPWQYRPQYLTREHQADWQPITPLQRERLMGFPDNYTQPTPEQPFDDRQRNTMLGNAWHLPTAIWLLFLLLIPTTAHIPRTPTMTALDQMTQAWLNNPLPFGPPPKMHSNDNMPQLDWQSHLRWARSQADSFYYPRPIDPTLMWAIQIQQDLHMPSIRQAVIQDIQHLIQQNREQTTEWHKFLPTHCRIAYQQPEMITQIPTLISLLERIQYPHTHILRQELSDGFPLLGQLQPGLQWHVRSDNKYTEPQSVDDLRTFNREYITKKLQHPYVDDNWELMADEIAAEVKAGRMRGPFSAPAWFPSETVQLHTDKHKLQTTPLPHKDPIIAMAFSIKQTGSDGNPKIRRGEDWRRSGHNRACQMNDQPYHHTPDHYISLAQHTANHFDQQQLVWGHDHDGAYRQLPLADPEIAYVLLQTPQGPTLWHHHVLLFGSAASVWAYNRFGDVLTHISRCLCGIPVVHYVDDYGSINTKQDADSSFHTFAQLNSILGFHMKPSKEQRPDNEHKIQGVIIQCEPQRVSVKPCPNRVRRLLQELHNHLHTNNMTPEEARRLAGKCSFTTTHLFGRVGRAPLRALYDKSFSNTSTINNHTRTAIIALREILAHCRPKTVPLHPEHRQTTIVYTDAFFSDGNTQFRNSDFSHEEARPDFNYDHTNGWAAVIFPPGKKPTIVHGSVPRKILQHFASNKAYIYFLEAWAAIITPVLIQPLLTNPYVQLCDNDPATHAINKGSGKHQPLNNLIGSHWAWHNRHQLTQILKRVPSKANIADPFSRRDFTIAESLGWNILQAPTEHLIPTVHKIVGNATFAHQQGLSRNDAIHQFRRNL